MTDIPVVSRRFTKADQLAFAQLSGDWNPMHMDDVRSRRTQAGAPVVHGMHAALWAMETMADAIDLRPLASIEIRFDRFIYVDALVALTISVTGDRVIGEISGTDGKLTRVIAKLGNGIGDAPQPFGDDAALYDLTRREPEVIDLDAAERARGTMPLADDPEGLSVAFPALSAAIDRLSIDSLAKVSTVVGMACPGRDSIFSSLKVKRVAPVLPSLDFHTESLERAFRLLMLKIDGGGWTGGLEAFLRHPPITQPSYAEIGKHISVGSFDGHRVLVIGGSRGLGEVVAKIAAAGGADVTITYLMGAAEARSVADEITVGGGQCRVLHFAANEASDGLDAIPVPTHIYYFATSRIFGGNANLYQAERAEGFTKIYVSGFYQICLKYAGTPEGVKIFYPSSIAVEERPKGMTEYAMSKAAGEMLAADINRWMPGVAVEVARLPRLLTDQTASVVPVDSPEALDVMLPLVKGFHGPSGQAV